MEHNGTTLPSFLPYLCTILSASMDREMPLSEISVVWDLQLLQPNINPPFSSAVIFFTYCSSHCFLTCYEPALFITSPFHPCRHSLFHSTDQSISILHAEQHVKCISHYLILLWFRKQTAKLRRHTPRFIRGWKDFNVFWQQKIFLHTNIIQVAAGPHARSSSLAACLRGNTQNSCV
jgi:hypothetical protein